MKSFSEYIKEDNDELNEKYNITPKSGGGGGERTSAKKLLMDVSAKDLIK